MELMKEQREGKLTIDLLLNQILSPKDNEKVADAFTVVDLRENLLRLGIDEAAKLSPTKLNQLYNLFEAWLTYRAIHRLVDGHDPLHYLEQHVSSNKKKYTPYKIVNYEELSRLIFTTKFREKTLILAYHDGIPSLRNVMSYNTVSHVLVMKFNSQSQKWEIQTGQKNIVREGPGFKIQRVKQENSNDRFVMTQNPAAVADEVDIESVDLPQDGQDYAVVHMGNIFRLIKDLDDRFLQGLGLDKVDLKQMFLRTAKDETLPGILFIFPLQCDQRFFDELHQRDGNLSGTQYRGNFFER